MKAMEVTVVFIAGDMTANDLGKLSGNIGFPSAVLSHGDPKPDKK
jgi:hypothetical protein